MENHTSVTEKLMFAMIITGMMLFSVGMTAAALPEPTPFLKGAGLVLSIATMVCAIAFTGKALIKP